VPHPCVRIRVVDQLRDGEGDLGFSFEPGVVVLRLRAGAEITHMLGIEMQHVIQGAHDWALRRDRAQREPGRHRRGRRRKEATQPPPLGPDHTMPLPITPTDRHGRGWGPKGA